MEIKILSSIPYPFWVKILFLAWIILTIAGLIVLICCKEKKMGVSSRSPLWEKTKLNINDFYTELDKELLTPWMFFKTGVMPEVKKYYGGTIKYSSDVGFEYGSSQAMVFWENIEPYLEHGISEQLEKIADEAFEQQLDPSPCINEAASQLNGIIHRVYNRMAEIDQKLRGKGYPNSVNRKDVSEEVEKMLKFLERHKTDIMKRAVSRYQAVLENTARLDRNELRAWIAIGISVLALIVALVKK